VKVVLGGDGGDELFAGFDRYLGVGYIEDYFMRLPKFIRHHLVGSIVDHIPENFTYKSVSQKLRWVHQLSEQPTLADRYAEATCFFRFSHQQKQSLFSHSLWKEMEAINSADVIADEFRKAKANDPVERMLYADYQTRLPEHSLMLTDRMTMAHGLELRSPFLDHELVSFMASIPRNMKIKKNELKYILRRLAISYLPPEIVKRPKHGFMFPVAYWFRNELYPFVKDYLSNSPFVSSGIFQNKAITDMVEEHRQGRIDHHVRLWMLLNLGIWHDLYIEGSPPDIMESNLEGQIRRSNR